MKAIRTILIVLLVGTFGFAGAVKLKDPKKFSQDIESFQLLSPPATSMVAVYLPWLEIISAGALLFPAWRAGAARVMMALAVVFVAALSSAWFRNIDLTCGCFGSESSIGTSLGLIRAVGLMVAIALLIRLDRPKV